MNALERRLFYIPSFKIYGSVAGFYDFGPPGCAIKQNFTALWRQHFVLAESMMEVCCWHAFGRCCSGCTCQLFRGGWCRQDCRQANSWALLPGAPLPAAEKGSPTCQRFAALSRWRPAWEAHRLFIRCRQQLDAQLITVAYSRRTHWRRHTHVPVVHAGLGRKQEWTERSTFWSACRWSVLR